MLNSKNLSKIVFLVICLIVVVSIVIMMLSEQKKMIISSNQNIEVAELIYSMKKTLVGEGCRENFSGLEKSEIKNKTIFLKSLTIFSNGDAGIIRKFHRGPEYSGVSETGLTIREYRISSLNNSDLLEVVFDRNYDGKTLTKEIPIYFSLYENGRIKTCSLSPIEQEKEIWESYGGSLFLTRHMKLRINEGSDVQKLNLSGLLYVEGEIDSCSKKNMGSFAWSQIQKNFFLCHKNELISLTDDDSGEVE